MFDDCDLGFGVRLIKGVFWAVFLGAILGFGWASGSFVFFEDGSFVLQLGGVFLSGCVPGFVCFL